MDSIEVLQARCGGEWSSIVDCRAAAKTAQAKIEAKLDALKLPADTTFVAVGSLARQEWTAGSDLDWMLLVDGQADESHLTAAHELRRQLMADGFEKPGETGVFGGLVFSHELIHRIGGDADTNQNTTRRVLMLLESASCADLDGVRKRVIRQLLKRYVEDDHGYRVSGKLYVPRFLLNDIVRYWRTMAVDLAAKRRERDGNKWALKRVKLRMSRKLIFAAGLSVCISCKLQPSSLLKETVERDAEFCLAMVEFLEKYTASTPLTTIAEMILRFGGDAADALANKILGSYDAFLAMLADVSMRKELEVLSVEDAPASDAFRRSNQLSEEFQAGLSQLFFDSNSDLTRAVQRYGVF